jgi:pimeloyl-ACP methyl ester carboxylesterase
VLVTGPGHGNSTDPGRRYTMQDCAAAAKTVLDTLGLDGPVDWVGNAWGGHVGVVYAATWPRRCRTLVTVGTPIHAYSRMGRVQTRLLLAAYRRLDPVRFIRDGVVETLLSAQTRADDPAALDLVRDSFTNADRAGLRNAVVSISLHRQDLTPLLNRIEAPTLFVTGADHSDWSPQQAESASRLLPHGSMAVVDGAAYLAPLENPRRFVELVRKFWATNTIQHEAT